MILAQVPPNILQEVFTIAVQGGIATVAILLAIVVLIIVALVWRFAPKVFEWFSKIVDKATDFIKALSDALEKLQRLNEQSNAKLAENTEITKQYLAAGERIEQAVNTTKTTVETSAADITIIKEALVKLEGDVKTLADSGTANATALKSVQDKLAELTTAVNNAIAKMQVPTVHSTTVVSSSTPVNTIPKDQLDSKE